MGYLPRKAREAKKIASRREKIAEISQGIAARKELAYVAYKEARGTKARMAGYIARPENAKTTPKKREPRQRTDEIRRHVGNQLAAELEFDF